MSHGTAIYWIVGVVGLVSMAALALMLCLEKLTRQKDLGPSSPTETEVVSRLHANGMKGIEPNRNCTDCGRLFIKDVRRRFIDVDRATGKVSYLCQDCFNKREHPTV
jgi:hypothetical protein